MICIEVSVKTGLTAPVHYLTIQKFFKKYYMQIASHEWNQVYNFPCGKQEQCKKLIDTSPECKYTAGHFETNSTYFRANETKSKAGGTMQWTSISSRTE